MQCAGNVNTYVSFQVNAGFEQDQRALRTIGSEWPDYRDKAGLAVWPGGGGIFRMVNRPKMTVWALGWFEYWDCSPHENNVQLNFNQHTEGLCERKALENVIHKNSHHFVSTLTMSHIEHIEHYPRVLAMESMERHD